MNISTNVMIISEQKPPLEVVLRGWLKTHREVFMTKMNTAIEWQDWGAVRELTALVQYTDALLQIVDAYPRG
ncbi:MAG: hypothetical protein ACPLPR_02340 [Bacillota bacterium]